MVSLGTWQVEKCEKETMKDWEIETEHGKSGPMGEDLFAEMWLRAKGVMYHTHQLEMAQKVQWIQKQYSASFQQMLTRMKKTLLGIGR